MPVGRVQVFNQVEAAIAKPGEEGLKGCLNVLHVMAAVVQDDVNPAHFVYDRIKESLVVLGADSYLACNAVIGFAGGIDVDSVNDCRCSKVLPPQLQAAAFGYADFQEFNGCLPKAVEITLIQGQVVMPLMNSLLQLPCVQVQ